MNERVVRAAFFPFLGALIATFLLSAYFATATGYVYGQEIRSWNYSALAKGIGAVLAAGILALIITTHSLRMRESQLEHRLMRWLEGKGEWVSREWDDEIEMTLEEKAGYESDDADVAAVVDTLGEKRTLGRLRTYSARLLAIPIVGLTLIAAVSLWAVPAAGAFLESQWALNTALIFLTSYGTLVVMGLLVGAIVVVVKE